MDEFQAKVITALLTADRPISLRALQLKIQPNPNYNRLRNVIRKLVLENKVATKEVKKRKVTILYYRLVGWLGEEST